MEVLRRWTSRMDVALQQGLSAGELCRLRQLRDGVLADMLQQLS